MIKSASLALALALCTAAQAEPALIDNERVAVTRTTAPLPPADADFVAVSLDGAGSATFGRKGDTPGQAGVSTVVIALKDHPVAPIPNASGYPLAFPRARAQKLLDNDRVVVWRYRWNAGEPTPMHFHDRDAVVVFAEDSSLKSTTPDGKSVQNDYKSGEIRFNRRDRVHSELLVGKSASAIITELK